MAYDNTNRGTLGRNKHRKTDKHPEYTGKINIDGREYWLSGWVKESNGDRFFSLAVKPKDAQPEKGEPAKTDADFDDDLPF